VSGEDVPAVTVRAKSWLQRRKTFERRLRPEATIHVYDTIGCFDRCDLALEPAGSLRRSRVELRRERQPLLIQARYAVTAGDILGGLAHRYIRFDVDRRQGTVDAAKSRVGREIEATLRHARHRFDTAADESVACANRDLSHGDMDR